MAQSSDSGLHQVRRHKILMMEEGKEKWADKEKIVSLTLWRLCVEKKNNVDKTKLLVSKHQTHKHIRHFIRTPNSRVKIDISWVLMQNTVRVCLPTLILCALHFVCIVLSL